ncbi:MAG: hypothetical protein ACRDO8_06545, partial [Nocardioidaceae bacterium]
MLTGQWLHRDLPASGVEITWGLSGGDTMRATVTPEVAALETGGAPLLDIWGTAIYAEEAGQIRWGGIVTSVESSGPDLSVTCDGFGAYPRGIAYGGVYRRWAVDPLDVVREIWSHVQSQPDGNLSMVVDGTVSDQTVGDVEPPAKPTRDAGETQADFQDRLSDWEKAYGDRSRYELVWWESTDCGAEIDTLATETPFDWREEHVWSGDDREAVTHR